MKYLSVALITVAAFAGDFLAYWAKLPNEQQKGWGYTSFACLIYAAWFFWRGRPGGPAEDEDQRDLRGGEDGVLDRTIERVVDRVLRRRADTPGPEGRA